MPRAADDRPNWGALADRALAGEAITPAEARAVLAAADEELLPLVAAVGRVRRAHFGAAVKLNVLLNAKSGRLKGDQAERLRAAGVFSYNHNLNTSERIAGGREVQLGWLQPLGLEVANSIFVGDYLTTEGQAAQADWEMLEDLGFEIEECAL